jgi:hypothetical protein
VPQLSQGWLILGLSKRHVPQLSQGGLEENKETINRNVYYIRPTQKENKLEKKQLHITGSKSEMLQLCSDVNEKIHKGMAKLSEKMYV